MSDMEMEAELREAGAFVERVIEQLLERGAPPVAVASALLGGALELLSRHYGDEAVLHILHNACEGVRAGQLKAEATVC